MGDEQTVDCPLPEHFEWFREQIAGHHPSQVKNGLPQIGFLKERGSLLILKLAQDGRRGRSERSRHSHPPSTDYGHFDSVPLLEDITSPFSQPAIMDIKVGKVTFDPEASEEKRANERNKYPPQENLGFRLLGYRMHLGEELRVRDKEWGRALREDNVQLALEEFLSGRGRDARVPRELLTRLERVKEWMEEQRELLLFASSLLIVYETDSSLPPSLDLRLIDFSHAFPANGQRDDNYLHGLRTLIRLTWAITASFESS